eukprot:scaffold7724_cov248-Pinguiococcus_pyrenoidosus.AAC.5
MSLPRCLEGGATLGGLEVSGCGAQPAAPVPRCEASRVGIDSDAESFSSLMLAARPRMFSATSARLLLLASMLETPASSMVVAPAIPPATARNDRCRQAGRKQRLSQAPVAPPVLTRALRGYRSFPGLRRGSHASDACARELVQRLLAPSAVAQDRSSTPRRLLRSCGAADLRTACTQGPGTAPSAFCPTAPRKLEL